MALTSSRTRSTLSVFTWRTVLLLLALFFLAAGVRLMAGARTIDDSYITFRYARNILAGNGFIYNPGEHVLGTTTPLYTILLVILGSFSGSAQAPFPQIALWVNALADGITCCLLLLAGRKSGFTTAGLAAALVWAIAPFSVTFAIGGLETSIFVLLLTGMSVAHLHRRHRLAAGLAALSLLTRPDALILIGPLALDRLSQLILATLRRKSSTSLPAAKPNVRAGMSEVLIFLLPILFWVVFATSYFGNPLPHSITAKSLAYRLPSEAAFVRLLQHYATPFLEHLTLGIPAIAVGLVLYPFLFLIGARKLIRYDRSFWPWLAYPWLYFITFAIANPLIFRWYLTPPLPPYFFGILVGAEALLTQLLKTRKKAEPASVASPSPIRQVLISTIVIASPFLSSLGDWSLHPNHGLQRPAPDMAWYQLELLYRQAADLLAPEIHNSEQTPLLAAGDVGVLGYYSGANILDTVGLNSPISSQYYPLDAKYYVINYAIPPDLILDIKPDYLVILEVYGRAGLLKDERFIQEYGLVEKIPTDIYRSDGMLIFRRIRN